MRSFSVSSLIVTETVTILPCVLTTRRSEALRSLAHCPSPAKLAAKSGSHGARTAIAEADCGESASMATSARISRPRRMPPLALFTRDVNAFRQSGSGTSRSEITLRNGSLTMNQTSNDPAKRWISGVRAPPGWPARHRPVKSFNASCGPVAMTPGPRLTTGSVCRACGGRVGLPKTTRRKPSPELGPESETTTAQRS